MAGGAKQEENARWTEENNFFSEIFNYIVHFLKAEIGLNTGGKSIFIQNLDVISSGQLLLDHNCLFYCQLESHLCVIVSYNLKRQCDFIRPSPLTLFIFIFNFCCINAQALKKITVR